MILNKEEIKHIAKLAKLNLSEEEIGKFQKQLSSILDYIELLNEVDTTNVEPTTQTTRLKNVAREDTPSKEQCLTQEEALENVSERQDGYIRTKAVL